MAIFTTTDYEICALGPYSPAQVRLSYDPSARASFDAFQRREIQERCEMLRAEGRKVEDQPLYRVLSWEASDSGLNISVGPAGYEEYVGLGRHSPNREIEALAVSAASQAGNSLIIEVRSQKVAEGRGMLHVKPSGHVHPPQDAWQALLAEFDEELAVQAEEIQSGVCLGLVRSLSANCYSLIYGVSLRPSLAEILGRKAVDAWEHVELLGLDCEEGTMRDWLTNPARRVTGPGHASVLLWGRHRFGWTWFEATCRALSGG